MGKKVVISIPVHEESLVVADHLRNIRKFVPNSSVILHVSADGPNGFKEDILKLSNGEFKDFAYVNDTYYHTYAANEAGNVTGLSTVHASNFRYIYSVISDFDVFALETSNDMFVRKGVENLWNNNDCGCGVRKNPLTSYRNIGEKELIDRLSKLINLKTIEIHAQEGTFYPKEVFKEISKTILNKLGGFIAHEELVIHTLAFNLFPELYNSNCDEGYIFHNSNHYATINEDIVKIKNGILNNKYAVKRVPRRINDPCRVYVNEVTKND